MDLSRAPRNPSRNNGLVQELSRDLHSWFSCKSSCRASGHELSCGRNTTNLKSETKSNEIGKRRNAPRNRTDKSNTTFFRHSCPSKCSFFWCLMRSRFRKYPFPPTRLQPGSEQGYGDSSWTFLMCILYSDAFLNGCSSEYRHRSFRYSEQLSCGHERPVGLFSSSSPR